MQNADDYKYFRNFALSDLQIEVSRAIKDKVATDPLKSAELKAEMSYFVGTELLVDDEGEVY